MIGFGLATPCPRHVSRAGHVLVITGLEDPAHSNARVGIHST